MPINNNVDIRATFGLLYSQSSSGAELVEEFVKFPVTVEYESVDDFVSGLVL